MTELPSSYKTVENVIIQQYAASARVSQMRFVVDKVTMEQVSLRVLLFFLSILFYQGSILRL
jgi:hypothetical protein